MFVLPRLENLFVFFCFELPLTGGRLEPAAETTEGIAGFLLFCDVVPLSSGVLTQVVLCLLNPMDPGG